jgi:hypothetical protein
MPRWVSASLQQMPAAASSWRSISVGIRCTTLTCMPRIGQTVGGFQPEQAAADDHGMAAGSGRRSMASTSARSRKVTTPGQLDARQGQAMGLEPVASSSTS